jgi:hypothetical protein
MKSSRKRDRLRVPAALLFAVLLHAAFFGRLFFGTGHAGGGNALALVGERLDLELPAAAPVTEIASAKTVHVPSAIFAAPRRQVQEMPRPVERLGLAEMAAKNPGLFGTRGQDTELTAALAGVVSIDKSGLEGIKSLAARATPASSELEGAVETSPLPQLIEERVVKSELPKMEKTEAAILGTRLGKQIATGIDMPSVQRTITRGLSEVRACYERAQEVEPGLFGVMRLEMTIAADGRVSTISVVEETLENEGLARCVASTVRGWTFPRPTGPRATVVYPLVFHRA